MRVCVRELWSVLEELICNTNTLREEKPTATHNPTTKPSEERPDLLQNTIWQSLARRLKKRDLLHNVSAASRPKPATGDNADHSKEARSTELCVRGVRKGEREEWESQWDKGKQEFHTTIWGTNTETTRKTRRPEHRLNTSSINLFRK